MFYRPSAPSLKQKLLLLLLLPVVLMLAGLGTAGFIHVRANLLEQWRARSLLGMARVAHAVDMRLALPRQFLEVFSAQAGLTAWGLDEWQTLVESLPGVLKVKLELDKAVAGAPAMPRGRGAGIRACASACPGAPGPDTCAGSIGPG